MMYTFQNNNIFLPVTKLSFLLLETFFPSATFCMPGKLNIDFKFSLYIPLIWASPLNSSYFTSSSSYYLKTYQILFSMNNYHCYLFVLKHRTEERISNNMYIVVEAHSTKGVKHKTILHDMRAFNSHFVQQIFFDL